MLFKFTSFLLPIFLVIFAVQAFPGNGRGRSNNRRGRYRYPRCEEPRPNKRLGMCYQDFEQPQPGLDPPSTISDPIVPTDGHNFWVYGNGTAKNRFLASHISTLLIPAHIYSTTVEVEFLEDACGNLAYDILRQIEDQTQTLLLSYVQEPSKIAELVLAQETELTLIIVPSPPIPGLAAGTPCQAKFTNLYDLRRYYIAAGDPPPPAPEFPEFANWLIFSDEGHHRDRRSAYGDDDDEDDDDYEREIHYYMERLPTKCKDIHQMLEVFPNCDDRSRRRLDDLLNNGRQAAVIQLNEIPGEPSLDGSGSPIDSVIDNQMQVYNAISLENYRRDKRVNFKLLVKRKIVTDTDIINVNCP